MKLAISTCLIVASCQTFAQTGSLSVGFESDAAFPTVLTPTRLRQSIQDVPASVTTITAAQLAQYGVTTIADALRFVPGMSVTQTTGSTYKINYHGTNVQDPRRLNVLIDGVSVYQPGLSVINWSMLPVDIKDVSRIEVTRGPDSASYGPLSMMAIINIITLNPRDAQGSSVVVGFGTERTTKSHARLPIAYGDTLAMLTISTSATAGFDKFTPGGPGSSLVIDYDGHDAAKSTRLRFNSDTKLSQDTEASFSASYVDGYNQIPFTSPFEEFQDRKLTNYILNASISTKLNDSHLLKVQANRANFKTISEWTACYPTSAYLPELLSMYRANPAYANALILGKRPMGGSPADNALALTTIRALQKLGPTVLTPQCGRVNGNIDETRDDIEVQDTYVFNDRLRMILGAGLRRNFAVSESYLAGQQSESIGRLFMHAEYTPSEDISINMGLYTENSDSAVRSPPTPRWGVNWHLTPNQTLRYSQGTGTRAPDLVERAGRLSYTLRPFSAIENNPNPVFYQTASGVQNLLHEVNRSSELGYLLSLPKIGLMLDVKVFEDNLTNLISQGVSVSAFPPTNDNSVRLQGVEIQASFVFSPTLSGFANYAYLLNTDSTAVAERTQYSKNSVSLGLLFKVDESLTLANTYSGSTGEATGGNAFGRLDMTLIKEVSNEFTAAMRLTHLTDTNTSTNRTTRVGLSQYNSANQAYIELAKRF